jgi:hypothetical protein
VFITERSGYYRIATGQGGYSGWTMLVDDVSRCNTPTSEASGVSIPAGLPPHE